MMIRVLAILVALMAPWSNAVAESRQATCQTDSLTFTLIPKKNIDEQLREYRPLISLIREGTGLPVDMVRASSYESVIDGVVSGAAEIAVLGPAAYLIAYRRNPGIEAFASPAVEGGRFTPAGSFYHSILIVRNEGVFTEPAALRGARIALSDPSSTSGTLIPKASFPQVVGVPFDRFFGAQVFAGGHDKALDALLEKKVDAAFVSSARADEYLKRGRITEDSLRVLWTSPALPYDPFVFSSDLCPGLRHTITRLMTSPSDRLRAFLEGQHASGINRVDHGAYEVLEDFL